MTADVIQSITKRITASMCVGGITAVAVKHLTKAKKIEAICVGFVAAASTSLALLGFRG